jgi:hypothetical protein
MATPGNVSPLRYVQPAFWVCFVVFEIWSVWRSWQQFHADKG